MVEAARRALFVSLVELLLVVFYNQILSINHSKRSATKIIVQYITEDAIQQFCYAYDLLKKARFCPIILGRQ